MNRRKTCAVTNTDELRLRNNKQISHEGIRYLFILSHSAKWQPQHAELGQVAELFREFTGQEAVLQVQDLPQLTVSMLQR